MTDNPGAVAQSKFGKNVGGICNYLGMTQYELSKRAGLTPAAISQIINGEREPTLKTIVKLLNALGVTFERLMQ